MQLNQTFHFLRSTLPISLCVFGLFGCSMNYFSSPSTDSSDQQTRMPSSSACLSGLSKYFKALGLKNQISCQDNPNASVISHFSGKISLTNGKNTLTPCNSHREYLLTFPEHISVDMESMFPNEESQIYGEFFGVLDNTSEADEMGTIKITDIELLSKEIKGCDRPRRPRLAFGTEPFWSTELIKTTLQFHQFGHLDRKSTVRDFRYDGKNIAISNDQIQLNLQRKVCTDGMSDSLYGWESTLQFEDKTYKGCASMPLSPKIH